jgi:colanic acid/amylovoran biosynthesis glycosyltransferase
MKNLLIYHNHFYSISEVFIYKQVAYLSQYFKIYLVANKFSNEGLTEHRNIERFKLNSVEMFCSKAMSLFSHSKKERELIFYNSFQISNLIRHKNIDLIHAHYGTSAITILEVAKKSKVPLIVSFHGVDASKALNNKTYADRLPELFEYASKIIIVSRHMIDTLKLHKWLNKVLLIPYYVDPEFFKPSGHQATDRVIRLLHSGRLVGKKGVPDLIRVFHNLYQKHNNISLTILGDGPELMRCKNLVSDLNLTAVVKFLGARNNEAVKQEMDAADIFVLNSRKDDNGDMEGTPVSLIEAMAMEKAVVSTLHAGIPDIIKNRVNGLLVAEKDNAALEAALTELIENPALRNNLAKEARNFVKVKLTLENTYARIVESITAAINEKSATASRRKIQKNY